MKMLFASALIALTLVASSAFATDNAGKAKATFQSAVYPMINSMKVGVNISKAKDSKVNIRLINNDGHTLVTKKLGKGHEATNFRFDLNGLEDGVYKVEISDGNYTEAKTVKLETRTPTVQTSRLVSMN
ncbi:T9SS type A sorting domain-containing protein [Larkinella insperata]|uniref:T9SS type A sorting domain-containing protein n=1 Tax=Larkinella insperata TaxID=332158 RepID=A0ABW3Q863_9BACT|nr:T9SS type A sorting domain-containing protein [Larkinella insperata]